MPVYALAPPFLTTLSTDTAVHTHAYVAQSPVPMLPAALEEASHLVVGHALLKKRT